MKSWMELQKGTEPRVTLAELLRNEGIIDAIPTQYLVTWGGDKCKLGAGETRTDTLDEAMEVLYGLATDLSPTFRADPSLDYGGLECYDTDLMTDADGNNTDNNYWSFALPWGDDNDGIDTAVIIEDVDHFVAELLSDEKVADIVRGFVGKENGDLSNVDANELFLSQWHFDGEKRVWYDEKHRAVFVPDDVGHLSYFQQGRGYDDFYSSER